MGKNNINYAKACLILAEVSLSEDNIDVAFENIIKA